MDGWRERRRRGGDREDHGGKKIIHRTKKL
jgi:hypothetical protein